MTTATQGPVWDLPTTMTKLLHFGMPLDEVVRRATAVPAKIMGYEGTVGTLKPGANADVAVFELRDDNYELTRQRRRHRDRETAAARPAHAEGRACLVRTAGRVAPRVFVRGALPRQCNPRAGRVSLPVETLYR